LVTLSIIPSWAVSTSLLLTARGNERWKLQRSITRAGYWVTRGKADDRHLACDRHQYFETLSRFFRTPRCWGRLDLHRGGVEDQRMPTPGRQGPGSTGCLNAAQTCSYAECLAAELRGRATSVTSGPCHKVGAAFELEAGPRFCRPHEENQLSWRRGTSRDDQEVGSCRKYTNQHRLFRLRTSARYWSVRTWLSRGLRKPATNKDTAAPPGSQTKSDRPAAMEETISGTLWPEFHFKIDNAWDVLMKTRSLN
jgi:hypothetical protein